MRWRLAIPMQRSRLQQQHRVLPARCGRTVNQLHVDLTGRAGHRVKFSAEANPVPCSAVISKVDRPVGGRLHLLLCMQQTCASHAAVPMSSAATLMAHGSAMRRWPARSHLRPTTTPTPPCPTVLRGSACLNLALKLMQRSSNSRVASLAQVRTALFTAGAPCQSSMCLALCQLTDAPLRCD